MSEFNLDFVKNAVKKINHTVKNILKNTDKNALLIAGAVIAVAIVGSLAYAGINRGFSLSNLGFFGMPKDQIADRAIKYINDNKLAQSPASLVSVSEESG